MSALGLSHADSEALRSHLLLSLLDEPLDHVAADVASLAGGQIAVLALLEVYAKLARNLIFHVVQRALGLRHIDAV